MKGYRLVRMFRNGILIRCYNGKTKEWTHRGGSYVDADDIKGVQEGMMAIVPGDDKTLKEFVDAEVKWFRECAKMGDPERPNIIIDEQVSDEMWLRIKTYPSETLVWYTHPDYDEGKWREACEHELAYRATL